MARSEKYRIEFKNAQGDNCTVQFLFEGWSGAVTYLTPAAKPFTLSEYNTSEDLFKPYRPQQATINIIASDSSVTMDSFLTDNDNDIEVIFSFGSFSPYWYGFILQDNFQETWIGTNHVLTLTATEGIGQLADKPFSNNGAEIVGKITPWAAIGFCLQESVQTLVQSRVYNSLYHTSMNSTNTDMCLDQCFFDARTFEIEPRQFETKLDVLSKINTSFGQTMFQYRGQWYFLRLEDLYIPTNTNLRGFRNQIGGSRATVNRRYDANIGVGENMQQITPEMLRYINRRTKKDIVRKNYEMFPECIQNSSFTRGNIVSSNPSSKQYTIDSWTNYYGTYGNKVANTDEWGLSETYIDTILSERSMFYELKNFTSVYVLIQSQYCDVRIFDQLDISFDFKYKSFDPDLFYNNGQGNLPVAYVVLETSYGDFALDNDGKWIPYDPTNIYVSPTSLNFFVDQTKDIGVEEYNSISVKSDPIPYGGKFKFTFIGEWGQNILDNRVDVKNFMCNVIPIFNTDERRSNITGHELWYLKADNLRNETETIISLEDNVSYTFRGSLFESDQITFTNAEWFRYRYIDERYPFLQQALIEIWEHNKFNRNKIDVNCFGLKFNNNLDPIGLINTFIFIDDDPDKVYYVLNMREIDFDAATWSATLIEVYDTQKDPGSNIVKNFQADVQTGSYSSTNYVPWVIIIPADFTLGGTSNITYNAANVINVNIACNISGAITSSGTSPVEFRLEKNGIMISSAQVNINNNPEYFNVDLSVNGISLSNGNILTVWIDTSIYSLDLTGGSMTFSYTTNTSQTFDTYNERYLTN